MKILYFIFLLYFSNFLSVQAQEIVKPLFPCTKKLKSPYGVTAHFAHTSRDYSSRLNQIKILKETGINNVRYDFWVPFNSEWASHKNLAIIDTATINTCRNHLGLLAILFVGWTGQRAWERINYYSAFLDYLIKRYKDVVPFWEVLNEVNWTSLSDKVPLDSTINYYMSVLPLTYMKLKAANPKIIVTSSGLADLNDSFLELMCKNGAFNYFDVLNFHTYDFPESFHYKFKYIRRLMEEYNWSKPVWITECGMPTHVDTLARSKVYTSNQKELEQAYRLPRTYIISFAYGVDKIFTYNLRAKETDRFYKEDHFGILHADLTPKPAFNAYHTLIKLLPPGASRPVLKIWGTKYVSYWKRPDGKKVYALWSSKEHEIINLNIKGKYISYDLNGRKLSVDDTKIEITPSVRYFVGGKKFELTPVE